MNRKRGIIGLTAGFLVILFILSSSASGAHVSLTLRLVDPDTGVALSGIGPGGPARLEAVLSDGEGNPLAKKVVFFKTTLGEFFEPSASALTDAKGVAGILLSVGNGMGEGEITARYGSTKKTLRFTAEGDQGAPTDTAETSISIELLDQSGNSVSEISLENPGVVKATLIDKYKKPVPNAVVFFSSKPALGRFDPEAATGLTDENGVATIDFHAGDKPGSGLVIATYNEEFTDELPFTTKGNEVMKLSISMVDKTSGSETSEVRNGHPGVVTAVLTDGADRPVKDQVILFKTNPELGHFNPESASGLTDGNGSVSVELYAGTKPGDGVLSANYDIYSASMNFFTAGDQPGENYQLSFFLIDDETGEMVDLSAEKIDVQANEITGKNPWNLMVSVKDGFEKPLPDTLVIIEATLGVLDPDSGKVLTDSNGLGAFQLLAGNEAGEGIVTATVKDVSVSQKFITKGDQQTNSFLSIVLLDDSGRQTSRISSARPGTVQVSVTDPKGIPLPNALIQFTKVPQNIGKFPVKNPTAITDKEGIATVSLEAGSESGTGTVIAAYRYSQEETYSARLTFTTIGDQAEDANILIELTYSGGGDQLSETNFATVNASLLDKSGSAMSGKTIYFSTFPEDAGRLDPDSGVSVTDSRGIATIRLLAGSRAGKGMLYARYYDKDDNEFKAGTIISNEQGLQSDQDYYLGMRWKTPPGNQVEVVRDKFPGVAVATLLDKDMIPVPVELIRFETNLGYMEPAAGTALTDYNGEAEIRQMAGTVMGDGILKASWGTYSAYIAFTSLGDEQVATDSELTLVMVDQSGNPTGTITSTAPGVLVATVFDAGKPIQDQSVFFYTTLGNFDDKDAKTGVGTTNQQGQANIVLFRDASGPGKVTAIYGKQTETIDFMAGP